jgi:hypothetical protein
VEQGRLRILEHADDLVVAKRVRTAAHVDAIADEVTAEILRM